MRLAIIELLDREGHARQIIPVSQWPVTIGRAIDCDVVLDDPHAAAHHASITERDGGQLALLAGDTVNGVHLPRQRLTSSQQADLASGEIFQIGATRLRVRRASDLLAPEQPLGTERIVSFRAIGVLLLALTVWNMSTQWLGFNPGGRLMEYLPSLLGVPVLLGLWSGFWSVGSKLVRHRFDFWSHAHVALRYTLIASVLTLLLPLAAFMSGWTFLSRVDTVVTSAVMWAMLLAHLTLIHPARRRLLAGVMATLFVAGVTLFLFRNYQVHDRLFEELYVSRIGPPSLRLAPAVPTQRFIDEARGLKAVLDAHVDDEDEGDEAEDEELSSY